MPKEIPIHFSLPRSHSCYCFVRFQKMTHFFVMSVYSVRVCYIHTTAYILKPDLTIKNNHNHKVSLGHYIFVRKEITDNQQVYSSIHTQIVEGKSPISPVSMQKVFCVGQLNFRPLAIQLVDRFAICMSFLHFRSMNHSIIKTTYRK